VRSAAGSIRRIAGPSTARVRELTGRVPQWAKIAVAAGLVGILLVGATAASGWMSGGSSNRTPQAQRSSAPPKPLIDAEEYVDERGIRLNVPRNWARAPSGSYIDFTDPADHGRRLRVNIEKSGLDPHGFLRAAGDQLKRNKSGCAAPYTEVGLNDVQLDGKQAAELEYTCGSGATQRHGIWRAVVYNGKAYHFFLTVPATRYDESKPIYQEMVQSFHLTV
jgi:hypothetical protein